MRTVTKKDVAKRTAKVLNEKIYTTEKFVDAIFTTLRQILSEANPEVRIEIRDNGQGIPVHIGEKVFTPNFSTKYTGSGLGLAITKRGIEHANGRIWFDSEEGVGTTFFIELPLA